MEPPIAANPEVIPAPERPATAPDVETAAIAPQHLLVGLLQQQWSLVVHGMESRNI